MKHLSRSTLGTTVTRRTLTLIIVMITMPVTALFTDHLYLATTGQLNRPVWVGAIDISIGFAVLMTMMI